MNSGRARGLLAIVVSCAAALVALTAWRTSDPTPSSHVLFADPDRNASSRPGTQAEVSIAIDRYRPSTALAVAMSASDGHLLAMSTSDFGATWSRTSIPLGEGSRFDNDPMVAFDSSGVAYLARIPVGPPGTLGVDVVRSLDGGRSWEPPLRVSSATDQDDKVALAVDDDRDSPYRDRVYVAWKWPMGRVYFSRSEDSGATFSPPQMIEQAFTSGGDLAVAGDGAVYLAFHDNRRRSIRVMRSTDGGATFTPSVAVADLRAQWYVSPPSQCLRPALVYASVAADRSAGPSRGAVYVAWADYPPGVTDAECPDRCGDPSVCVPDVYFSRSVDGGATWSLPALVTDAGTGEVDRYHQWIRVDPSSGAIFVAFKDSRNDPMRAGADVYLSRSRDGGANWEPAIRLSSATSRTTHFMQFGDYQSVAAAGGNVYAAWADYRSDPMEGEIYVRRLFAVSPADRQVVELPDARRPSPRSVPARP